MNLFEKIFNYQIISRLDDSGTFMTTSQERAWLKTMLDHPSAVAAFTEDTLAKLRTIVEQDTALNLSSHLIEKARSKEKQLYHPLIRELRRHIMQHNKIRLTFTGNVRDHAAPVNPAEEHPALPYKLEYSMVKKEWYLLWYHLKRKTMMSTRLSKLAAIEEEQLEPSEAQRILAKIERLLDSRKREVRIEVLPMYNRELSRILYALSSFEKTVDYNEETDVYSVTICLMEREQEYLLSKLRFLGKRVRVINGGYLKRRMLETTSKALERYGVISEPGDFQE
ncbi:WYL domain-containing protein [Paenibacillus sp. GXUN7292]|uniref:WYL domain-containing protein n=1 Tax=Paenibacillus sp. GXUN7292 TaxID=3422499 RepID=UPI003D7C8658